MMFIKESYVYTLPASMHYPEGPTRWVACGGGSCGYERTADDSTIMYKDQPVLLRMFKVNGVQTCEACLKEWKASITEWLE